MPENKICGIIRLFEYCGIIVIQYEDLARVLLYTMPDGGFNKAQKRRKAERMKDVRAIVAEEFWVAFQQIERGEVADLPFGTAVNLLRMLPEFEVSEYENPEGSAFGPTTKEWSVSVELPTPTGGKFTVAGKRKVRGLSVLAEILITVEGMTVKM